MKQLEAFPSQAERQGSFAVGPIVRHVGLVLLKLSQGDITLMVFWQVNTPARPRDSRHALAHVSLASDMLAVLVTSKDIHARIRRILNQSKHTSMAQPPPDELA